MPCSKRFFLRNYLNTYLSRLVLVQTEFSNEVTVGRGIDILYQLGNLGIGMSFHKLNQSLLTAAHRVDKRVAVCIRTLWY